MFFEKENDGLVFLVILESGFLDFMVELLLWMMDWWDKNIDIEGESVFLELYFYSNVFEGVRFIIDILMDVEGIS